jgi:hypothetical protein
VSRLLSGASVIFPHLFHGRHRRLVTPIGLSPRLLTGCKTFTDLVLRPVRPELSRLPSAIAGFVSTLSAIFSESLLSGAESYTATLQPCKTDSRQPLSLPMKGPTASLPHRSRTGSPGESPFPTPANDVGDERFAATEIRPAILVNVSRCNV